MFSIDDCLVTRNFPVGTVYTFLLQESCLPRPSREAFLALSFLEASKLSCNFLSSIMICNDCTCPHRAKFSIFGKEILPKKGKKKEIWVFKSGSTALDG